MKKTLYFIMAVLLLAIVTAIPPPPLPIVGKITGDANGMTVNVLNERSGVSMETTVNSAGQFLVDWANSNDNGGTIAKYMNGDNFKVSIGSQVVNVKYSGQPEIKTEFTITGGSNSSPSGPDPLVATGIIGAVAILIAGGYYLSKKGVLYHDHPGHKGSHSANIKHKVPYNHRLYKNDRAGCIEDTEKIKKEGKL